jgi:hypothetical protein
MHASQCPVNIPEFIDGQWRLLARATGLIAQRNTQMRTCTNLQEPRLSEIGNLTSLNLVDYRMDVQTHVFMTSALVGGEWSASRPCPPGAPCIGGWVDPLAGLNDVADRRSSVNMKNLEVGA